MNRHKFFFFVIFNFVACVLSQHNPDLVKQPSIWGKNSNNTGHVISLLTRDKKPSLDVVMDYHGFFLAKYSGLHEFSLVAGLEASLQFGVEKTCKSNADDSVSDSLAVRTSRKGKAHKVLLEAGFLYPLKIVHALTHGGPTYLEFRIREPHGEFTADLSDRIFQTDFGVDEAAIPHNDQEDLGFLPGCKSENSKSFGLLMTIRAMGGYSSSGLSDDFFLGDYKMMDPWGQPQQVSKINNERRGGPAPQNSMEVTADFSDAYNPLWYFKGISDDHLKLHYDTDEIYSAISDLVISKNPVGGTPLDFSDPRSVYAIVKNSEDEPLVQITEDSFTEDITDIKFEPMKNNLNFTGLEEFVSFHPLHSSYYNFEVPEPLSISKDLEDWDLESGDGKDVDLDTFSEEDDDISFTNYNTEDDITEWSYDSIFENKDENETDQLTGELLPEQLYEVAPDNLLRYEIKQIQQSPDLSSAIFNLEDVTDADNDPKDQKLEFIRTVNRTETPEIQHIQRQITFSYLVPTVPTSGSLNEIEERRNDSGLSTEKRNHTDSPVILRRVGRHTRILPMKNSSFDYMAENGFESWLKQTETDDQYALLHSISVHSASLAIEIIENPWISNKTRSGSQISIKPFKVGMSALSPPSKTEGAGIEIYKAMENDVKQRTKICPLISGTISIPSKTLSQAATIVDHSLNFMDEMQTLASTLVVTGTAKMLTNKDDSCVNSRATISRETSLNMYTDLLYSGEMKDGGGNLRDFSQLCFTFDSVVTGKMNPSNGSNEQSKIPSDAETFPMVSINVSTRKFFSGLVVVVYIFTLI